MVTDDGNGGRVRAELKLERRDYLAGAVAIFGAVAAAIGIIVPLLMYIFQTRTEAVTEHAAIEKQMAAEKAAIEQQLAVDKAVAEERKKSDDKKEKRIDKRLGVLNEQTKVLDENVRRLLWDANVKPKPMPAGADFDFDDVE